MQQFKKIALASAVSAVMMASGVAEAHVSYNTSGSVNGNAANGAGSWTGGIADGYAGKLPANWIANVHNEHNGMSMATSYTVSTAGVAAEEAEASLPLSGFKIQSHNNKWNPANSWGAALGFGLIDMHGAGNLTIEVSADTDAGSIFTPGFTLFSGWDAGTTSSKHQAWNNTGDVAAPNTLGSTDLSYVGHSSTTTTGGSTSVTFYGLAAGEYSLWIGGNGTGCTAGGSCTTSSNQQYIANISTSPVPVPAAAWLMGSAILGLAGMRRKTATVA